MGLFGEHLPAVLNLEKKIEEHDIILKQTYEKGQRILYLLEELERFIIKNIGAKKGEEYVETFLKPDFEFINSRVSMNELGEAEARIRKIRKQFEDTILSNSKVVYASR